MAAVVPSHAATGPSLAVVIAVAALSAGVLVALAAAAFGRRRSRSYLLVTLALGALLAQEVVGWLALTGTVADGTHHLVEHALDVVLAGLVLAAVLFARRGAETREDT
jgi:Kef-type K+ transport system membrane component KefB